MSTTATIPALWLARL